MKILELFKKKDLIINSFDKAFERNVLFPEEYDTLIKACKNYEEANDSLDVDLDKNEKLVSKATYALSKLFSARHLRADMINTIATVAYLPRLTNKELTDYFYERLGNEIIDLRTKDGVFLPYVKILDICGIKDRVIKSNKEFTTCYNYEELMKRVADKRSNKLKIKGLKRLF